MVHKKTLAFATILRQRADCALSEAAKTRRLVAKRHVPGNNNIIKEVTPHAHH